jgi:hypothetical protein
MAGRWEGVLELCPRWPVGGSGGQYPLEAVVAVTSEAAWLRETHPMTSRVVGPCENPVT